MINHWGARYGRKQFSKVLANNAKLMEVTSRYAYTPCDGCLELRNEDTDILGFESNKEKHKSSGEGFREAKFIRA